MSAIGRGVLGGNGALSRESEGEDGVLAKKRIESIQIVAGGLGQWMLRCYSRPARVVLSPKFWQGGSNVIGTDGICTLGISGNCWQPWHGCHRVYRVRNMPAIPQLQLSGLDAFNQTYPNWNKTCVL